MQTYVTVSSFWTTTTPLLDLLKVRLLRITAGLLSWLAGAIGYPSPRRPQNTYLRFLAIGLGLATCSTVSYPTGQLAPSKPLLTTSGMTCMELEKRVRTSYLREGCAPYETEKAPTRYSVLYVCKGDLVSPRQFVWQLSWATPPAAFEDWCITQRDSCIAQPGVNVFVLSMRRKTGNEKCEEVK